MSEIFYKSMSLHCADDGVTRTVHVKCYRHTGGMAADTAFSVPATCRIRGKYVHGFVTPTDGLAFMQQDGEATFEFRAHASCKHLLTGKSVDERSPRNRKYRVQVNKRYHYFTSKEIAKKFCETVFKHTGAVLGLERIGVKEKD